MWPRMGWQKCMQLLVVILFVSCRCNAAAGLFDGYIVDPQPRNAATSTHSSVDSWHVCNAWSSGVVGCLLTAVCIWLSCQDQSWLCLYVRTYLDQAETLTISELFCDYCMWCQSSAGPDKYGLPCHPLAEGARSWDSILGPTS
jgi:hypothetical protein